MLLISFHQEHYLADALRSVAQNFSREDEIVIAVLDSTSRSIKDVQVLIGEVDHTVQVVKLDTPPFSTVKVLHEILPLMKSESIVLLAADDALADGYKSAMLSHLSETSDPVVLNSRLLVTDEVLEVIGKARPRWSSHRWLNRLWLFFENPGKAPGSVIPRQAVLDSDFMKVDPRCKIEDFPLWLLMSKSACFRCVGRDMVLYRQHPTSLSKKAHDADYCWSVGYCIGLAETRAGTFLERLLVRLGRKRWYRQTDDAMRQHVEQGRRTAAVQFG